jgi:predicted AAA+ superfamily ATPase
VPAHAPADRSPHRCPPRRRRARRFPGALGEPRGRQRDVRSLAQVGSLRDLERFVRACALRSANRLNKADLARDVGIAPSTANQRLAILEASGQIILLEPWFSNRTTSLVKSPKLYFADTGLLCALRKSMRSMSLRR